MKILVTADWHIRGDMPRCRNDENWLESQATDIRNVKKIIVEEKCDALWILGDLFHQPRCSTEAVNMLLRELAPISELAAIRILPGNHDLPYHDYGNLECCSLGIVLKTYPELKLGTYYDKIRLYTAPFGLDDPYDAAAAILDAKVWATHRLTFPNAEAKPVENCGGYTAQELLDMAPDMDTILTGDYHHGYIYEKDGRRVVTPGCLNIQAADMADYTPGVFVWDTDTDVFKRVKLPKNGVVVTDYLTAEKERENRMTTCLEVMKGAGSVSLSFIDNLAAATQRDDLEPETKEALGEVLDKLNKDRK